MSVISGTGAFPNNGAPVYGTPIFPSTMNASQWNAMAQYQQPAPGSVAGGAVVNRPGNNSWQSEVPVEGQVRLVRGKTEWTRYIEAGDQIFAIMPNQPSKKIQLEGAVMGFNLYTANRWLRERHAKAIDLLYGGTSQELLTLPEWHQVDKIMKTTELGTNTALKYLTVDTILKEMHYLGVNNTQSSELKSLDQRNGHNISASHGEPMVVFGTRGPHRMRNVWGNNALPGRHLWIILKRWAPKAGELSPEELEKAGGAVAIGDYSIALSANRPFQLVPYVSKRWESNIPDKKRVYDGLGGYMVGNEFKHFQERGHAFYVGQVLMSARRTAVDESGPLRDAAGLASLDKKEEKQERPPPSSATSYEDTQALEYFQVQVNPQAFGSFVILA